MKAGDVMLFTPWQDQPRMVLLIELSPDSPTHSWIARVMDGEHAGRLAYCLPTSLIVPEDYAKMLLTQ